MEEEWIGKAVSIECDDKLGVFQGIIKDISETQITIVRAFRNGVPLRKQDAEVTLRCTDISKITLIPTYNAQSTLTPTVINKPTPVKQPNFALAGLGAAAVAAAAAGQQQTPQRQQRNATSRDNNCAVSQRLAKLKLGSNGVKNTPTRASSAQQQLQQFFAQSSIHTSSSKASPPNFTSNSVAQFFGNLIPPKVEVRMGTVFPACLSNNSNSCNVGSVDIESGAASKPIDIVNVRNSDNNYFASQNSTATGLSSGNGNGNGNKSRNGNGVNTYSTSSGNGNGNGNSNKKQRRQLRRENSMKQNQTFGSSMDDPLLNEDFDFEGNLALFDKQAIWNVIESGQKPDLVRQAVTVNQQQKYRHDENILVSEPLELRQIETMFDGGTDFVTDEGLIIPTIPIFVRGKIELTAEKAGLSLQRQIDILARGATDLAIMLLGGARRLTPNNCHQWPKVVIICEKSENFRASNIGAATGRQVASHGLKVLLYLEEDASIEQKNIEISLFKATGNAVVYSVSALPKPDLVILSTNTVNLSGNVKKWLSENRASILAIDPPPSGIQDVLIKYAILPILPLNGISSNNCGKLYLCNLGLPDKFYRDAGIKYKSPFGHKFVIPIHSKD